MSTTSGDEVPKLCCIDPFCYRQFPLSHPTPTPSTSSPLSCTTTTFESVLNSHLSKNPNLQDGYAPFCKHVFMENVNIIDGGTLTDGRVNTVEITEENEGLIRTAYEARNEKELPVLTRFIPKDSINIDDLPQAKYLDVILYSREQIIKENAAMNVEGVKDQMDVPWGVVSIKLQTVDYELPMNPITAMRNGLGEEFGGSGKEIEREEYMKAVEFWGKNVVVK